MTYVISYLVAIFLLGDSQKTILQMNVCDWMEGCAGGAAKKSGASNSTKIGDCNKICSALVTA